MNKIDAPLSVLRRRSQRDLVKQKEMRAVSIPEADLRNRSVSVFLKFTDNLKDIEAKGFKIRTVVGNIATGEVPLDRLDDIAALPNVIKIEASQALEPHLDEGIPDIRADAVHETGYRGKGVIVGIVDSGLDPTHPSLINADGSSRILRFWHQRINEPAEGEHPPRGLGNEYVAEDVFQYGVEYTKEDIDAALLESDPSLKVRYEKDTSPEGRNHGTHVTGIAAGNGRGTPADTYIGVAPEADIIFVCVLPLGERTFSGSLLEEEEGKETTGDSVQIFEAIQYIFKEASRLEKPAVVNLSMSGNTGPHDGTSMLEQGIDLLLDGPGKAFVCAAGNEAMAKHHAEGVVGDGTVCTVLLDVKSDATSMIGIDIWYSADDSFTVSLRPGGSDPVDEDGNSIQPFFPQDLSRTIRLDNGNDITVESAMAPDPDNGSKRIYIEIETGAASKILKGTWELVLGNVEGTEVNNGGFHAWIRRFAKAEFASHATSAFTLGIPATSKKVIAVANYYDKGVNKGQRWEQSSMGPTRDGRQKPEIAAPGQSTLAPAEGWKSGNDFTGSGGTSAAAPYVTGAVALMLEKNNEAPQEYIKKILTETARSDDYTGAWIFLPNARWGYGKLDIEAAMNRVVTRWHLPSRWWPFIEPFVPQVVLVQMNSQFSQVTRRFIEPFVPPVLARLVRRIWF